MNSGGVEAVVKDGRTGVLVTENDVAKFAAALDELIQDKERRAQMGSLAMAFARQERNISTASAQLDEMLQGVANR
jgi:glycosyltransferase involved in cell wall biosynthesis